MEDRQIVELFWQRSEQALAETAAKYGSYCHAIAFRLLRDQQDAEESVNDAYLDAWNSIPPHRPETLSTFLGKLVRHIAIDRLRKNNAQKRGGGETALALEELEECLSAGDDVEREVERNALSEALNAFVASLPSVERRVFLRRYWFLDSIEDICGQFGFSQSKVKSMLHRTREKLRRCLSEQQLM